MPTIATGALFVVAYLLVVRAIRYKRRDSFIEKERKHGMNYKVATSIVKDLSGKEFPFLFLKSLQLALFRTYAIPSISKLLLATGQLSKSDNAGKRYADTSILISEWLIQDLDEPRAMEAMARVNYLHGRYVNTIKQEDLLFTLALFILEPIRWIQKYGWRDLTQTEQNAIFAKWIEIGNRMAIKNLPESLDALIEWSDKYEEKNMIYTESNAKVGEYTIQLLLSTLPFFVRPYVTSVLLCLMDHRLRTAMGFEDPPKWLQSFAQNSILLGGVIVKYMFVPRASSIVQLAPLPETSDAPHTTKSRYNSPYAFGQQPWYVAPSLWQTFGVPGVMRLLVQGNPPGGKYKPEGYCIRQLGPLNLESKGEEEVEKNLQILRERVAAVSS
ncbi:Mycophenolic acid synthesis protein B [Dipodascopsis tothii]|uniref:Mycophenolic acid synthesis protein B n=1 Tax=Dipodascopsis tothii TaxID=44089 RepID=UPI0034CF6A34